MARESEGRGPMSRRAGSDLSVSGAVLIALGILLVLQSAEVIPWELWEELWRFWPLVFIAAGVNILVGRRSPWLALLAVVALLAGSVGAAYALTGLSRKIKTGAPTTRDACLKHQT